MLFKRSFFVVFLFTLVGFVLTACATQEQDGVRLPSKVQQTIDKKYAGAKITEIDIEEENGKEIYEVELKSGDKEIEVVLDADGKIITEKEDEEEEIEVVFNFDQTAVNTLPKGWKNQKTGKGGLGTWVVLADSSTSSKPNVLAQTSKKQPGYHFNLALAEKTEFANLKIKMKFKAIDGQEDQGGGPFWRYQDADNYYVCRANPLEDNFRFYKVVDGNRKQLASATVKVPSNVWHTIKVKNVGNHIQCWLDGELYLDLTDDTFKDGKVGLWTKADAVTYFDDFKIESEEPEKTESEK
jgi:outer membrane lipoprotein-sorting protein